jgi:hypothetical protein
MSGFFWDVAVDVVAALAAAIVVALAGLLSFKRIRRLAAAARYAWRMNKAGISNFFSSRQEFATLRRGRSISEYLLLAQKDFLYVGFYLSGATDRARVDTALRKLLQTGRRVELVLLAEDTDEAILIPVEQFLAIATGTLQGVLAHAFAHFKAFAATLSTDDRARFSLRRHRALLASSAFLIDHGEPQGRMLIDTKIHGAGRDFSCAIEFTGLFKPGLATEYAESFQRIAQTAETVDTSVGNP